MELNVLKKPYNLREAINNADECGMIKGVISISLSTIIESDMEEFLDIIEALLTEALLEEVCYHIVDVDDDNNLFLEVSGYLNKDEVKEYHEDCNLI